MARFLVQRDGLFLGSSSAVNLVACVKLVRKMGWSNGEKVVTVLCVFPYRPIAIALTPNDARVKLILGVILALDIIPRFVCFSFPLGPAAMLTKTLNLTTVLVSSFLRTFSLAILSRGPINLLAVMAD
jgi:hypothetical protein